jgi:hypothetical protein
MRSVRGEQLDCAGCCAGLDGRRDEALEVDNAAHDAAADGADGKHAMIGG